MWCTDVYFTRKGITADEEQVDEHAEESVFESENYATRRRPISPPKAASVVPCSKLPTQRTEQFGESLAACG